VNRGLPDIAFWVTSFQGKDATSIRGWKTEIDLGVASTLIDERRRPLKVTR
jgi:hypothetical protein